MVEFPVFGGMAGMTSPELCQPWSIPRFQNRTILHHGRRLHIHAKQKLAQTPGPPGGVLRGDASALD